MRSLWTAAGYVACVALMCGAGFGWHTYKVKSDQRRLAEATRMRAERGDASAERDLGVMYYYGKGVPQSYTEAMSWARKAADQGDPRAQYDVGYFYEYGLGVAQDFGQAFPWMHKAANQGEPRAESVLGGLYFYGDGVTQDHAEALRWYRKSADQGIAPAEQGVGAMYYHGDGVAQDYAEAARWYRKAADQGDAKAEYAIGYMYNHGQGVPRDRAEANRWLRKAAVQGDGDALRTISLGLSDFTKFTLFLQIFGGSMLTFHFLPTNFRMRVKSLRDPRNRAVSATGILCLISAGVGWYGYTHFKIWRWAYGVNAYTLFRGLLDVLMVAALIYIVRLKPEEPRDDSPTEAPTPA